MHKKIVGISLCLVLTLLSLSACSKKVISTKGTASKTASSTVSSQVTSSKEVSSSPVSSKPEEITVPNIVGSDKNTAMSQITALGLVPDIKDTSVMSDGSSKNPKYKVGTISSVEPKVGSPVKVGSKVSCTNISGVNYYSPYYSLKGTDIKTFSMFSYKWIPISVALNSSNVLTITYHIEVYGEASEEYFSFPSVSLNGTKGNVKCEPVFYNKMYTLTMSFNIGNSLPKELKFHLTAVSNCRDTQTNLDPADFTLYPDWSRSVDDVKMNDSFVPAAPGDND